MELSKYYHNQKVSDTTFAIFNSLLMQVAFIDTKTLQRIEDMNVTEDEVQNLLSLGVYVLSKEADEKAHANLIQALEEHTKNVSIMYLCVSSFCNLACKYCFIEQNPESTNCRQLMEIDTARIAVDKFCNQLKPENEDKPQIILYGGEPLTNWNLISDIIPYIVSKQKNIQIVLITNGTLLNSEICDFLKEYDVGIGISLDGPKDINDKNRIFRDDNRSVYDVVAEKITLLNEHQNSYSISATITEDIIENSTATMETWKSIDAKAVFWNIYHFSEKDPSWETFYQNMSDFILKNTDTLEQWGIPEGRMMELINNFLSGYFRFQSCASVGLNQIAVQSNGDVCVCQGDSRSQAHIIGNINLDDIQEMLKNPEAQKWLKLHTLYREECLNCESIFSCGGGCPMQAEVLFGSRSAIDRASCIFYKKVFNWLLQKCYLLSADDK